jgi:uncharacterized protein
VAASVTFGPAFWRDAFAAPPAQPGAGPYGPLLPPDANGIMLPQGFTSRVIARSGQLVPSTLYVFPPFPDGQATFRVDGGWILVTNSEVRLGGGGVSAIRFDSQGATVDAYRILGGTSTNCAGGPTPWGTWLSCEEFDRGRVWECDPTGRKAAVPHPAMGIFQHEATCVDPVNEQLYLTEDLGDGGLYRYTPDDFADLTAGRLEVACDGGGGLVVWKTLPDPLFQGQTPLRGQHLDMLKFARGEGIWYDAGLVYVATSGDESIHVYDTRTSTVSLLYRAAEAPGTPLRGVDNVHVSRSGDLYVAEDTANPEMLDLCIISPEREVARFLSLTGDGHVGSETVGITFDPTGTRLYLGSQRFPPDGIVYEISGPFRLERPVILPPPAPAPPPPVPPDVPGMPIGIAVSRRISIASLIRRGLAVGLTLDRAATVRVRLRARIKPRGKPRRTVTLAAATRRPGAGHTTLRIKPTKAQARILRARRQRLTATVEVRITTPGLPVRNLRATVTLRP